MQMEQETEYFKNGDEDMEGFWKRQTNMRAIPNPLRGAWI